MMLLSPDPSGMMKFSAPMTHRARTGRAPSCTLSGQARRRLGSEIATAALRLGGSECRLRMKALCSNCYLEVLVRLGELIWADALYPGADLSVARPDEATAVERLRSCRDLPAPRNKPRAFVATHDASSSVNRDARRLTRAFSEFGEVENVDLVSAQKSTTLLTSTGSGLSMLMLGVHQKLSNLASIGIA
jgi:hypothetical protein